MDESGRAELDSWLGQSGNRDIYEGLAGLWDDVRREASGYEPDGRRLWRRLQEHSGKSRTARHLLLGISAAAAVVLVVLSGLMLRYLPVGEPDPVVMSSVCGKSRNVLPDGTVVWLKDGSSLEYDAVSFGRKDRKVLLKGEAYFDVNKDKRPFIVNFTSGRIQVLGTEFGIRSYEDDSCHYATLVEGLVHIYTKEGDSLEILPGEQAMISPNEFTKRKVQVDEYVGWKDGFFVFRQRSLGEIATQLEKWYDVQILFANDDLPKLLFTGYLKRYDDIDVFFDALKRTGLINYHIEGNHILVTTN